MRRLIPCSQELLRLALAAARVGVTLLALLSTAPRVLSAEPPAQKGEASMPSPPARELTLEEAIALALQRQPRIQASLGDLEAARARVNQALSPLLPQSSITGTTGRNQSFSGTSRTISLTNSNSVQITLEQKLFDFGKTWAATDAARASAEVSRAEVDFQKDLLVESVKESYFTLLLSKRLVTVNEQALERAELNLRSAKGFFEVGTRPKSDVTRVEVDVANARVNLIRARNAVRLARASLNTALAVEVDAPTEVRDILFYEPFPVDPKQLPREALANRPEYTQLKAREAASEATLRQTQRQFLPDLTGSGSYGGSASDPPLGEIWSLALTLSWNWFDGLNNVAKYREAKANLEASQARTQTFELQIRQEVQQAALALTEAEERIGAAAKGVESAQENFRLAQGRFDAGVGTILELTDAQLALTQAQSSEAQALADFRIAKARLERSLGRR